MKNRSTKISHLKILLLGSFILTLCTLSANAMSQNRGEFFEGKLIVEEIITEDLDINNLTVTGPVDFADGSINLSAFDASGANTNDIMQTQSGKMIFGPLVLNPNQNALIGSNELIDGSVRSRHIINGAVTNPKIQNTAANNLKIANSQITSHLIANGAITANKIRANNNIFSATPLGVFVSQAGTIDSSKTIKNAIEILDNRTLNNQSNLQSKLDLNNSNINNGANFNGPITVNGNVNITGSLSGANAPSNSTTATDLAGAGNLNSVLYQISDNQTAITPGVAKGTNKVLAMESQANPVPTWKDIRMEKTGGSSSVASCNTLCASQGGVCIDARRSQRTVSCFTSGSPFDLSNPNNTGAVDCTCYRVNLT